MKNFTDLGLSPFVLQAITEMGFLKPSDIQSQALPILLGAPTDFIGLAATGTGKTAAFAIPLLEKIDPSVRGVQALILCPTRELALQVSGQVDLMGKYAGIRSLAIYGGAGYENQFSGLKRGVSVVVATPGRLVDHLNRGTLSLAQAHTLILDEADEMITMGFKEDLEAILRAMPKENSNTWLFSATMSREVRGVADQYLENPKQVQVNLKEMLSGTVEQIYYKTHENDKPEILCKLIDVSEDFYGLVFFQTKSLLMDVYAYLKHRGYKTDCLHGDMDQSARERIMKQFRDRKINILLCTDVASRGLDVKDITHVINYSLPRELDSYVHRIGRTARSGKSGVAMNLVNAAHRGLVTRIERATKSKMKEGVIPTRKEIGAKKVALAFKIFHAQTGHAKAAALLTEEWKTALSTMTVEEVAGRFLNQLFPEVFAQERVAPVKVKAPSQASHASHSSGQGHKKSAKYVHAHPPKPLGGSHRVKNRGYKRSIPGHVAGKVSAHKPSGGFVVKLRNAE